MSDVYSTESIKRKRIALNIDITRIRDSTKHLIVVKKPLTQPEFKNAIEIAQEIAGDLWIWNNPDGFWLNQQTLVSFLFLEPDHALQFKLSV